MSSPVRSARHPEMDSNLSSVPPVWPSPRPDSWGTAAPQAATSGARGNVILSPTPPVECLSTVGRGRPLKSIVDPDAIIADVHRLSSERVMPRQKMAIARAAICSSATTPRVKASITQSIWSAVSSWPSRLAEMTEVASDMVPHSARFEVVRTEGRRQQVPQRGRSGCGVDEQSGPAELEQQLPASAAGHQLLPAAVATCEGDQTSASGRMKVGHEPTLCAEPQTI